MALSNLPVNYSPEFMVSEIGCNDGVFLNHLVKNKNIKCIGVDPAENVVKRIKNNRCQSKVSPELTCRKKMGVKPS